MIYFFHKREDIYENRDFLSSYCNRADIAEKAGDLCEVYKLFYDMADYIYDKRFDGGYKDEELYLYVTGEPVPAEKAAASGEGSERLRLRALEKLLRNLIHSAPESLETDQQLLQAVLFCLAKGNVCLRISNYHTHYFNYEQSDFYGKRAQELLWRAKQLVDELVDKLNRNRHMPAAEKNDKKYEYILYKRLIKLNLAKFHRNFARKNRRSDFDAALDELYHTCNKIKERFGKAGPKWRRQYALLWLDAVSDIAFIQRNRNKLELAHKETILVYCELKKIMQNCRISWGELTPESFWENADELLTEDRRYWRKNSHRLSSGNSFWNSSNVNLKKLRQELSSENNYNQFLNSFSMFIETGLMEDCGTEGERYLPYDVSRFFMLVLNELSVLRSGLHDTDCYRSAVKTAILADEWSRIMDGAITADQKEKHSIDAINNMSVALRKYYKFTREISKPVHDNENAEKEFSDEKVTELLGLLAEYAEGNYTSRSELVKWYCLSLGISGAFSRTIRDIEIRKSSGGEEKISFWQALEFYFPELTRDIGEKDNIQNLFLCALILYHQQAYSAAVRYLNAVLKHREADYIRVASVGTKTRFLKASCLIALGKYKEAEAILLSVKEAMEFTYQSKGGSALPHEVGMRYQDERIESRLAYCYMLRGDYRKARKIYEELFGWLVQREVQRHSGTDRESVADFSRQTEYRRLKPARQIYGLCNLAGCLILSGLNEVRSDRLDMTYTVDDVFACINRVKGLSRGQKDEHPNKKAELFRGYQCVLFPAKQKNGREATKREELFMALEHFKIACDRKYGFFGPGEHFTERTGMTRFSVERNEPVYREKVEAFSAYLIALVELSNTVTELPHPLTEAEKRDLEKKWEVKEIKKILLSLPESVEVSLKAAMSLAGWILGYKKWAASSKVHTLVPQLFRSFSYLRIYEERGARVFNELKEERGFRFFSPEQRGEILARLLLFYEPIKKIKEEYSLCLRDKPEEIHLYHYTSIDTLKALLSGEGEDTPKFRINNCGYMNDLMEGSTFLKKIENMYRVNEYSVEKPWERLQERYYPQLNQTSEHVMPNSSDVYVACVSVREDSFPMWSIYGNQENGCNIEFDKNFFNVAGATFRPEKLRKYSMSRYTDDDYPLYKVHYLNRNDLENCDVISKNNEKMRTGDLFHMVEQSCGTSVPELAELNRCIAGLTNQLFQFDNYLDEIYRNNNFAVSGELYALEDPRDTLRRFAANRMDEVRFLFKNSDYSYESEVRTVYTVSSRMDAKTKPKIDMSADTPGVYVEMNREIKDVTVTLGSLIDDSRIDRYVTWLKQTGKVKRVRLAVTNRKK